MMRSHTLFIILAILGIAIPAFADDQPLAADNTRAFQLSYNDAETAIAHALSDKGAGGKLAATINGRKDGALFSYSSPVTAEIRGLQFDATQHRWSANLLFMSGSEVVSAIPASGRFEQTVEVPVLKREVRNGEVIGEKDIELHDFLLTQTRGDTITDMAELIGKAPLRTVSPGRPIREHEIASPAVVKKNGLVQIRYTSPGMQISATGQAMDDGAKGDTISVRNTASRKIVRAVVSDQNTVDVLAPGIQTSQLTGAAHVTN